MRRVLSALLLAAVLIIPARAAPPVLTAAGVVHAADFAPVADRLPQGGIISLFGANLARSTAAAGGLPLPIMLPTGAQGTRVMIGTVPAPLFYVSPGQINLQVPIDASLSPGSPTTIQVVSPDGSSDPIPVKITTHVPGIFTVKGSGYGSAVALINGTTLASGASPAKAGDTLVIYGTGFGAGTTDAETPASGTGATTAVRVRYPVQVQVGGQRARVDYAGFTPGFAGLYQLNVVLPPGFVPGDPLVVTQGGTPVSGGGQTRPGQTPAVAVPMVAANATIIGDIPPGGNVKVLPLPQGVQALGDPQLEGGDRFLAWETAACATGFWLFQYHDAAASTRLSAPDGVPCIARKLQAVVVAGGAAGARMLAAGLEGPPPALSASLVLFNFADGSAEARIPPASLSARRFEANSLTATGANAIAFGRNSDGSGGAGLLLHDLQKNAFSAVPQPDSAPFYGGTLLAQPATASTPYTIYAGAGASATGPWDKLATIKLSDPPTVEFGTPTAAASNSPGTRTIAVPRQPLRLSLSKDGNTYNVRVTNTQTGNVDVIAMPTGFQPEVTITGQNQNQVPEVVLVDEKNLLYALATKNAGSPLVNSVFMVNYQTKSVVEKPLPLNVRDLSQITDLSGNYAGTLIGLANSDSNGGAANLLLWDPSGTTAPALFSLPSGVGAIGRGDAGKAAILGGAAGGAATPGARSDAYLIVPARQLVLAYGSNRDPSVADAGLVVFDLRSGSSRRLALPDATARLSDTGGLIYKAATNKAFALAEGFGQSNANQVAWFDLGAGANPASGLVGFNQNAVIRGATYDAATGMLILTAGRAGYIVAQLP